MVLARENTTISSLETINEQLFTSADEHQTNHYAENSDSKLMGLTELITNMEPRKRESQDTVRIFNEERNAYTSCPPAYETKEQQQEEDIFGLKAKKPRQLEYIEESPEE